MTTTITFSSNDTFKAWQKKARQLFNEAKAEETRLLNEEFAEVLADHKACQDTYARMIDDFTELLSRQSKSRYSWEEDKEILGEHMLVMAEMERLNAEFLKKWGTRYDEYCQLTEALEKLHADAMKQTRNRAAYKNAMAAMAAEESEKDGDLDA